MNFKPIKEEVFEAYHERSMMLVTRKLAAMKETSTSKAFERLWQSWHCTHEG